MRLATFRVPTPLGPFERLGALLDGGRVLDLNAGCAALLQRRGECRPERLAAVLLPADMLSFLEGGGRCLDAAREALDALGALQPGATGPGGARLIYSQAEVRLRPPLPNPPSLRDFLAFEEHARRGAARRGEPLPKEWYEQPMYYKGNARELYGPDDEIPWPAYTRKLDFELEIACVVGCPGRNLRPEQASECVAGYCLLNDFSARDVQRKEMLGRMGPAKGKDFATALGPCLVTADELADLDSLELEVRVNGETWSRGRFGERHWDFETMLAHVSQEETLRPGDLLGSGTFYKGCGLDLDRWIQPGDVIELEAKGLGVLRNTIGRPAAYRPLEYRARAKA